ncbi:MAG: response regulator [Lachnospiraceae bacterium]|nr:response regulator [Lachnospiraceae bacterium]
MIADNSIEEIEKTYTLLSKKEPDYVFYKVGSGEAALHTIKGNKVDVAFIETGLSDMDGIELAQKIQEKDITTDIVFISENGDKAAEAFEIYASAYLIKPLTYEKVAKAIENLRHYRKENKHIKVQCFGYFEAWADDIPIIFERKVTKQLFAYLIDRNGALCDADQMICALWPEKGVTPSNRNYIRRIISDLRSTFNTLGFEDVLVHNKGLLGINKRKIDCDYYRYLEGDPYGIKKYRGEYMSQYSFAENTNAKLSINLIEKDDENHYNNDIKLSVKCFGGFNVYHKDEPLIFTRKKTKELFAFLVYKGGTVITAEEACSALWPEELDRTAAGHRLRTVISDLKKTLKEIGLENILIRKHRQLAIRRDMIECDHWNAEEDFEQPDVYKADSYMQPYPWAEPERERLINGILLRVTRI